MARCLRVDSAQVMGLTAAAEDAEGFNDEKRRLKLAPPPPPLAGKM